MDKNKIIKIVVSSIIAVLAIIYYIVNNKTNNSYNEVLANDVIINNTEEKISEETTESKSKIKVYVTGEVASPGVIELEEGDRVEDAIEEARRNYKWSKSEKY